MIDTLIDLISAEPITMSTVVIDASDIIASTPPPAPVPQPMSLPPGSTATVVASGHLYRAPDTPVLLIIPTGGIYFAVIPGPLVFVLR